MSTSLVGTALLRLKKMLIFLAAVVLRFVSRLPAPPSPARPVNLASLACCSSAGEILLSAPARSCCQRAPPPRWKDGDGTISFDELEKFLKKYRVHASTRSSAQFSEDQIEQITEHKFGPISPLLCPARRTATTSSNSRRTRTTKRVRQQLRVAGARQRRVAHHVEALVRENHRHRPDGKHLLARLVRSSRRALCGRAVAIAPATCSSSSARASLAVALPLSPALVLALAVVLHRVVVESDEELRSDTGNHRPSCRSTVLRGAELDLSLCASGSGVMGTRARFASPMVLTD